MFGGAIEAIESFKLDRDAQRREQHEYDSKTEYEIGSERLSLIQQGTDLRDLIVPALDPQAAALTRTNFESKMFKDNLLINSWIKRHIFSPPLRLPGDPDLAAFLNPTQIQAIANALDSRIMLIQGPPGTGKTQCIVGLVSLLKQHFQSTMPILVCAPTHAAVDHLTSSMAARGLRPLRMGRIERVRPDCHQWAYESFEEQHPLYSALQDARDGKRRAKAVLDYAGIELANMQTTGHSLKDQMAKRGLDMKESTHVATAHKIYQVMYNKVRRILKDIRIAAFSKADVVISTAMGTNTRILDVCRSMPIHVRVLRRCRSWTSPWSCSTRQRSATRPTP
jgi:Ni2+-binding GTPase involved in maturation of urease and hydrogenase